MVAVPENQQVLKREAARQKRQMQDKKRKKLSEMKVITSKDERNKKARQLSLFEYGLVEENPGYSNMISFLGSIPRFFWGVPKRTKEGLLPTLERTFRGVDQVEYDLAIKPAIVDIYNPKTKKTEFKSVYPGVREEIIEDVLLKMVANGRGAFLNDEMAVIVSLYAIRKELKAQGHSYTLRQIKESLSVMTSTNFLLKPKDRKKNQRMEFSIISAYTLRTEDDLKTGKKNEYGYIVFSEIFKEELKKAAFRMFNYAISMKFKRPLARWLFKRLSERYRQAAMGQEYTIKASKILELSALIPRKQFRDTVRAIREALSELQEKNVILSWEEEKLFGGVRKNKMTDVKFIIKTHPHFNKGVIKANKIGKEIMMKKAEIDSSL